jgi:hypothetical protein
VPPARAPSAPASAKGVPAAAWPLSHSR